MCLTVPVIQKAAGGGSREPRLPGPAWATYQDSVSKGKPTNKKERKYFLSSDMGKRTWIY